MMHGQKGKLNTYEELNSRSQCAITDLENCQNSIDVKELIIKGLKGIYKNMPLSVDDFLKEKHDM